MSDFEDESNTFSDEDMQYDNDENNDDYDDNENVFSDEQNENNNNIENNNKTRIDDDSENISPQKNNNNNDNIPIQKDKNYYDSSKYKNMQVNNEIKRLFEYINQFEYNEIELDTILIPFIPNYIPCIGTVDKFIKPEMPKNSLYNKVNNNDNDDDNDNDNVNNSKFDEIKLGINVLNEACLNQSDPSTFDLKLRSQMKKHTNIKHIKIRSIKNAEENSNKIKNWIENMNKLKKETIINTNINTNNNIIWLNNDNNYPDIDILMQPFNIKIEKFIEKNKNDILNNKNIDLDIQQYIKIICSLFDIPVYNNKLIPSLHLLFSLYSHFKSVDN